MALPINIDDLIRHRRVESARIEYKKDWNPERVLHSVCAFANDIDNWGGGYVIIRACEGNGSPLPRFETDEDRRQLRVVLPIHPAFLSGYEAPNAENNPFAVQKPSVETLQETTQETKEETSEKGGLKSSLKSGLKSGLNKTDVIIVDGIESNAKLTIPDLMGLTGLSRNGVKKALDRLKSAGIIRRIGPDKGGHWEVVQHSPSKGGGDE